MYIAQLKIFLPDLCRKYEKNYVVLYKLFYFTFRFSIKRNFGFVQQNKNKMNRIQYFIMKNDDIFLIIAHEQCPIYISVLSL